MSKNTASLKVKKSNPIPSVEDIDGFLAIEYNVPTNIVARWRHLADNRAQPVWHKIVTLWRNKIRLGYVPVPGCVN